MTGSVRVAIWQLTSVFGSDLTALVQRLVLQAVADALELELAAPQTRAAKKAPATHSAAIPLELPTTVLVPAVRRAKPKGDLPELSLLAYEREALLRAMHEAGGRTKAAAALLGLPKSSLYRHADKAGIDVRAPEKPLGFANHLPLSAEAYERDALERAVSANGGDKLAATKALGVGKSTLYRKAVRLGVRVC